MSDSKHQISNAAKQLPRTSIRNGDSHSSRDQLPPVSLEESLVRVVESSTTWKSYLPGLLLGSHPIHDDQQSGDKRCILLGAHRLQKRMDISHSSSSGLSPSIEIQYHRLYNWKLARTPELASQMGVKNIADNGDCSRRVLHGRVGPSRLRKA